ncbi:DSBA-like thioredoxin domain-containing protein [Xylariales sp. PMI_506]|nr:DSBA-like thioredoxin domain-containing protein [Xylariales sp. PMI_506]
MAKRIELYLDLASMYSYVAFKQVTKNWEQLQGHGVTLDIKPVLLGAINAGSGNKPPWSLPAKAKYGRFDFRRSKNAAGIPEISPPDDLMSAARTMVPLRALHYIKASFPLETYLRTWHFLFHCFWGPNKLDISQSTELAAVLAAIRSGFDGPGTEELGELLFSAAEVSSIMKAASEDKWKNELKATVEEALHKGAFGAPWIWVTNAEGKSEPFFGSDRWHFIYEFLGLPFQSVELVPAPTKLWSKSNL